MIHVDLLIIAIILIIERCRNSSWHYNM